MVPVPAAERLPKPWLTGESQAHTDGGAEFPRSHVPIIARLSYQIPQNWVAAGFGALLLVLGSFLELPPQRKPENSKPWLCPIPSACKNPKGLSTEVLTQQIPNTIPTRIPAYLGTGTL